MSEQQTDSGKLKLIGVVIGAVLPSLVTYAYFHLLADSDPKLQQGTYSVGKLIQFAFPLFWVLVILRHSISGTGLAWAKRNSTSVSVWSTRTSISFAVIMGLLVAAAMFGIYRFAFPESINAELESQLGDRVTGFGVNSVQSFLLLSLFYAGLHSFLEEYYYRWFVFGQLRCVTGLIPAMVISGLAFMGHHVIVLTHYFDGLSPLTIFLSLAIAIGGMIWAWQYEKSRSLIGPWLSHLLVDAGIFAIGYVVLTNADVI